MNVAILHFHLRRGGVGSVLMKQAACILAASTEVHPAIVAGSAPELPLAVPHALVPSLDYDALSGRNAGVDGPELLADQLEQAFHEVFDGPCDLIHVHNPLIRKNSRLLGALLVLQERGYPLIVQAHDFAEDFRPEVYDRDSPYPGACDYIAINTRDRDYLIASGLEPGQVSFIPNPIAEAERFEPRMDFATESSAGRSLILYPVRAIRRKNLGEAILLSRYLPKGAEIAVTLPPTSPVDLGTYARWKALAASIECPMRFEAGLSASLDELYASSARVLTTSVKEGFGFSFIDPLARGIPVAGREVPHVVRDFRDLGIEFPSLYTRIDIPREALPQPALRAAVEGRLRSFRVAYGPCFPGDGRALLESSLSALALSFAHERLDFGALDEDLQALVIARLRGDAGFEAVVHAANPDLDSLFETAPPPETSRVQRVAIATALGEGIYAARLIAAYRSALEARPRGSIDKARLLLSFLQPGSFFLVAS